MGGEGEAKIGLQERGDRASKGQSHSRSDGGFSFDRDKSTFVEIDSEAGCGRELIENSFKVSDMTRDRPNDDESVIRILKDRAGKTIYQRVQEKAVSRSLKEELLKDINNNIKKERRKRIPLMKTATTLDPPGRDAIKKNHSLASVVDKLNPLTPKEGKAFRTKNAVQSIPTNLIKGFAEVRLKNSCRSGTLVAGLNDVSIVHKVFSNGAA
jgi:hypothetical protein